MGVFQVACSAIFMFYILQYIVQSDSFAIIQIANDFWEPGVFKYQDKFYMVGRNKKNDTGFSLKSSKDLLKWDIESNSLLSDEGYPKWVKRKHEIYCPEIHIVQNKFNFYFYAYNTEKETYNIGVLTADTILGPYRDVGRPLLALKSSWIAYPHIAHEGRCIFYSGSYKNDSTEISSLSKYLEKQCPTHHGHGR